MLTLIVDNSIHVSTNNIICNKLVDTSKLVYYIKPEIPKINTMLVFCLNNMGDSDCMMNQRRYDRM